MIHHQMRDLGAVKKLETWFWHCELIGLRFLQTCLLLFEELPLIQHDHHQPECLLVRVKVGGIDMGAIIRIQAEVVVNHLV